MNNLLNNPLNNSIDNEQTLGGDQQLFSVRWDKVCQGKPRSFIFRVATTRLNSIELLFLNQAMSRICYLCTPVNRL